MLQYIDASHFLLLSIMLIVFGIILLTWKYQCQGKSLKDSKTEQNMKIAGTAILTAGALAALMSLLNFQQNVKGTTRIPIADAYRLQKAMQGRSSAYGEY